MDLHELKEKKVGELVKEDIKTAHVFKKYGIDFCCGGGVSIEHAGKKQNVSIEDLVNDLLKIDNNLPQSQDYDHWPLDVLSDHIITTHHSYVEESIPLVLAYAHKVAQVHGEHHPPVIEILRLFTEVARELSSHMLKEEMVLFPYIKHLMAAKQSDNFPRPPHFGTVENPIHMMEMEHESAGTLLKEIATYSNNYTPPDWACNTFKALYAKLDEFEQDLHLHIHLENNILFPKAIQLEKELSHI